MIRFALKNLRSQPVRSILSMVGISIAIVGVVCIFAFSRGLKSTVSGAINLVDGVVILEKNKPDPIISSVPLRLKESLEDIRGVAGVVPCIWAVPGSVQGRPLTSRSLLTPELVGGVDLQALEKLKNGHLYERRMVRGRFLKPSDTHAAVISKLLAGRYGKEIGDRLSVDGNEYRIVGLYSTGNKIMDMAIVLPIDRVRPERNLDDGHVSDLFVVPEPGVDRDELIEPIETTLLSVDDRALEKWDVRSRREWQTDFSDMMNEVDTLLFLISSLAVVVGTVGIINTMLMSVTERTSEFGILIANGWSRYDVVRLILLESATLGILSGLVGIAAGWGAVHACNALFDLAIDGATPLSLLTACFLVALLIGVAGGLYPAYRAASKDPIEAIRSIR